jgi:hypothetical protein
MGYFILSTIPRFYYSTVLRDNRVYYTRELVTFKTKSVVREVRSVRVNVRELENVNVIFISMVARSRLTD